jgi:hypothetical protein
MSPMPFLADRASADLTTELMAIFGDDAGQQAAVRADRSRDRGNMVGFCRWRQVERMILFMENGSAISTRH